MYHGLSIALFWVALAGLSPAAVAEDATLLDRCFTPQALAGTASEIKPQHNHAKLDLAALRQAPIPAASPVPEAMRGSIRGVELPPGVKLIALTFDLCETDGSVAGYDGRIVDLLRREDVKATFFAGGKWMETHPERMEQLLANSLSRSAATVCATSTWRGSRARRSAKRSGSPKRLPVGHTKA